MTETANWGLSAKRSKQQESFLPSCTSCLVRTASLSDRASSGEFRLSTIVATGFQQTRNAIACITGPSTRLSCAAIVQLIYPEFTRAGLHYQRFSMSVPQPAGKYEALNNASRREVYKSLALIISARPSENFPPRTSQLIQLTGRRASCNT